jgi:CheY-like chemotaxis protein
MVQREHYDVIFMDHMMPEMDGVETTEKIRALEGEYYQKLPIIALTANAIMGMKEMFLAHSFNDYLSKPIEIPKLDDILTAWIPKEKQIKRTEKTQEKPGEEPPLIPADFTVEGLNIQTGKARYQEKMYLEVLRSYCVHSPALMEKIKAAQKENFAGEALKEYTITVHGLKGASFGICADEVAKLAEALERAAKENNIGFITANTDPFIKTLEKLVKRLEELLDIIARQAKAKTVFPRPDPALLKELAEACAHFRANAMEETLGKLEMYQYENGSDLITWLREQADNLEYEAITERLSKECE